MVIVTQHERIETFSHLVENVFRKLLNDLFKIRRILVMNSVQINSI